METSDLVDFVRRFKRRDDMNTPGLCEQCDSQTVPSEIDGEYICQDCLNERMGWVDLGKVNLKESEDE